MIRRFVSKDCFHQAVEFFHSMHEQGFLPNNFIFSFLLKACTRLLDFELGNKLHTPMVKGGFDYDVFLKTGLVYFYTKCGDLTDVEKVFDDIFDKNMASWIAIISGYIEFKRYEEAIDMFWRLLDSGLRLDSFIVVRVLFACTQLENLRAVEWIHSYWLESGVGKNVFVSTSLVDMYTKLRCMESARAVFEEMSKKDIIS